MLPVSSFHLQSSFLENRYEKTTNNTEELIEHYLESFRQIKNEISSLEILKRQAMIVYMQNSQDLAEINNLYKQFMCDLKKDSSFTINQQKPISSLGEQIDNNLDISTSIMKPIDIQWTVEYPNKNNEGFLSLRCYVKTGSVICAIAYDPSGTLFAFANTRTLFVVSSSTIQTHCAIDYPTGPIKNDIHVRVLKFSPDGNFIAIALPSYKIGIFSLSMKSFIQLLDAHSKTITSLCFLKSQHLLVSGGRDGLVCIWDINNGMCIKSIKPKSDFQNNLDDGIVSISTSFNYSYIIVCHLSGSVDVYDSNLEQTLFSFIAHKNTILSCSTSPTDNVFVTTSHERITKLWRNSTLVSSNNDHIDSVICSSFSYDGRIVFTGSKDESIIGFESTTGQTIFKAKVHTNTVLGIEHNPRFQNFLSCSGDGLVCVWDYKS